MKNKLDLRKNGETSYDYSNDILFVKAKDKDYSESIELNNVVIDLDFEWGVIGIRFFDASEVFNISKNALKSIKELEFNINVEDNTVSMNLWFNYSLPDKSILSHGQNLVREVVSTELKNSEISCTA